MSTGVFDFWPDRPTDRPILRVGDSEKKVHEIPARDTYCLEPRYAIKKLDSSPLGYATTPLTASAPKKPTGLLMSTITKSFVPFHSTRPTRLIQPEGFSR